MWSLYSQASARNVLVFEKIACRTDGTDKLCKCVQYLGRTLSFLLKSCAPVLADRKKSGALGEILFRVDALSSFLSGIRKVMRLGKWTYSLPVLRSELRDFASATNSFDSGFALLSSINSSFAVLTDFHDDLGWLVKMGVLPAELASYCGRVAAFCWFVTCWFDVPFSAYELHTNSLKIQRLQFKLAALHGRTSSLDSSTPPVSPTLTLTSRRRPGTRDSVSVTTDREVLQLEREIAMLQHNGFLHLVILVKYVADFVAAGIGALDIPVSEGWVPAASLVSALTSTYKLFVKAAEDIDAKRTIITPVASSHYDE